MQRFKWMKCLDAFTPLPVVLRYNTSMPQLLARLFGFPVLASDHQPVKMERRKTLALLVYLFVERGQALSRENLATLLWPEMGPGEAAASVRHALWEIHRALPGEEWLLKDGAVLRGNPAVWVDVQEFQSLLAAPPPGDPAPLQEAVALYQADFLAGFTLRDTPVFDRWQAAQTEHLRAQMSAALEALGSLYVNSGEYDAAVATSRRWLALDPLNEAAHRALMRQQALTGQRSAACRQYEDCAHLLEEELGVEPEALTQALYHEIRSGSFAPPQAVIHPPAAAVTAPPRPQVIHLPRVDTSFVGRESELEKIAGLLSDRAVRLVSLIGPGGGGKTRLAIEAAQRAAETGFEDGVFFIPLAPLTSPADFLPTLASALSCPPLQDSPPTERAARLARFIGRKHCLLVLDNLEHLLAAEEEDVLAVISGLLEGTEQMQVLVTSRQHLNLAAEWMLEVEGMPVPGYRERTGFGAYSSVQLFLKSAARARADFTPTEADWPAIGRICQLVEGLPLGIELAAAWVRVYTCAEISQEIERNLDFLYSNLRGIPERHQSLRAAFEYSWRLLSERERSVFRKLAVFPGSFSREAAAQVAGASLSLLMDLMDHSLLHRVSGEDSPNPAGTVRQELHEVLRQYAREKLVAQPQEETDALDFHRAYFLNFLMEQAELLKGYQQGLALHVLEADWENVKQAWQRALDQQRYLDLLRAVPALILFLEMSRHEHQVSLIFEKAMRQVRRERPPGPESPARRTLLILLMAAYKRFSFLREQPSEELLRLGQEALEMARALPDGQEKAEVYILLNVGGSASPIQEVIAQCRESLAIFSANHDNWGQAIGWLILGDAANMGLEDYEMARSAYQSGITHFEAMGNAWGKAVCLSGLGIVAAKEQDFEQAGRYWAESVALHQRVKDVWREVEVRAMLSDALEATGRLDEAAQALEANVSLLARMGEEATLAWSLAKLARNERRRQQPEQASMHTRRAVEILNRLGETENISRLQAYARGDEER